MITNGQFVSKVLNDAKALTKDGHISQRWILDKGKTKAKFLMAQKLDEKTLFKEDGLITNIDCFRMKRIKSKECDIVEFRVCEKIMKSCNEIPEGIFGKNGSSIFSVTNVDDSLSYRYITPMEFLRRKKRRYKSKNARFYTIKDNYLYILNSVAELVNIAMITTDPDSAEAVSECGGCSPEELACKSLWDQQFVCPDKYTDLVAREVRAEVLQSLGLPSDENPNLDEHQKTKTTK